jgi:hypothetical protein
VVGVRGSRKSTPHTIDVERYDPYTLPTVDHLTWFYLDFIEDVMMDAIRSRLAAREMPVNRCVASGVALLKAASNPETEDEYVDIAENISPTRVIRL